MSNRYICVKVNNQVWIIKCEISLINGNTDYCKFIPVEIESIKVIEYDETTIILINKETQIIENCNKQQRYLYLHAGTYQIKTSNNCEYILNKIRIQNYHSNLAKRNFITSIKLTNITIEEHNLTELKELTEIVNDKVELYSSNNHILNFSVITFILLIIIIVIIYQIFPKYCKSKNFQEKVQFKEGRVMLPDTI